MLVGVDGSPESFAARDLAAGWAAAHDASLTVAVAWQLQDALPVEALSATELKRLEHEQLDQAQAILDRALAPLTPRARGTLLPGAPARALEEEARDEGADLLVVGSRGYALGSAAWSSAVSDWLVHNAPCPVLVVPRPAAAETTAADRAAAPADAAV